MTTEKRILEIIQLKLDKDPIVIGTQTKSNHRCLIKDVNDREYLDVILYCSSSDRIILYKDEVMKNNYIFSMSAVDYNDFKEYLTNRLLVLEKSEKLKTL